MSRTFVYFFLIVTSCFRRLLTDFSCGAAIAGEPDRLRGESEREKSEDPPIPFAILTNPRLAGRLSGEDGIELPYLAVRGYVRKVEASKTPTELLLRL